MFNNAIHFAKSQCIEYSFLISWSTNSTLYLFDLNSCHNSSLSSKYFIHTYTSVLSNHASISHFTQSKDSSLYQVVWVRRTF